MRVVYSIIFVCLAIIAFCFYSIVTELNRTPAEPTIIYNIDQELAVQIYRAGYLSGHYRGFKKHTLDTSWAIDSTIFIRELKLRSVPKKQTEKAL